MLQCLLQSGADVNALDEGRGRPLHLVRVPEHVVLLARYGACYDLRDSCFLGDTPQQTFFKKILFEYDPLKRMKYFQLICYIYAIGDVQHSENIFVQSFETMLIENFGGKYSKAVMLSGYKPKHLKKIAFLL